MFNEEMDLTPAVVTVTVLIFAILWYVYALIHWNRGPSLPPGPRGLPIVGYLPFLAHDLHKQYTKMARVVLRKQDGTFANRNPPLAASIGMSGHDIVWSNNNSDWLKLRKIFVHEVLNNKNLEACRVYRRDEVRRTIKNVYDKIGRSVNITDIAFLTVANVLTSMIWQNTSVKGDKDRELVALFQTIIFKIAELTSQLNVFDLFPSLARFDIQGIVLKAKLQRKQIDQIFTSIIHDRKRKNSGESKVAVKREERTDFLQILLDLMEEKNATSFSLTQIKAILSDMMIAGTDTTTTLIEWAMTEIMHDDKVRKRVQGELAEIVGLNNTVEESHLSKLPFLIPRSPSQSCIVAGYTIPKGCTVFVNVWAIHRDP
ncbi:cytochrome P450 76C1-like protein [Tanacetum coccineum]